MTHPSLTPPLRLSFHLPPPTLSSVWLPSERIQRAAKQQFIKYAQLPKTKPPRPCCHCILKHRCTLYFKDKSGNGKTQAGNAGRRELGLHLSLSLLEFISMFVSVWGMNANRLSTVGESLPSACGPLSRFALLSPCSTVTHSATGQKVKNKKKMLWEEARWKIFTLPHYSETWVATRLKRNGEKLVILAHSLWTWPDETQATQSKRFQRRAHWRLLGILIQCGIQFLWEPRGLSGKVNYLCCSTDYILTKCMQYAIHKFQSEAMCWSQIWIPQNTFMSAKNFEHLWLFIRLTQ